jgi:site-specific DNA recombinase
VVGEPVLRAQVVTAALPCAIYTRKSSEDGLEQGFNSLDAQREACAAFIQSQKSLGWKAFSRTFEDGGYSGGNIDRPGLAALLDLIDQGRVRVVVVYKVDRLTRSLADFAKLVERFDAKGVSFVSVTQQFNTTTSMGRLTLNVLLSFAQFEREVTGERIRDKIAASKKKGLWMGGMPPMGYRPHERTLVIDPEPAERIREIYRLYLELGNVRLLKAELDARHWRTVARKSHRAGQAGNRPFARGHLYRILNNPVYRGQIAHKGAVNEGQHEAIIDIDLWNAVQTRLRAQAQGEHPRGTRNFKSLLGGILFDENGERMVRVHAAKGVRRYHYYVSRRLHAGERGPGATRHRIPAIKLDDTVRAAIVEFLGSQAEITGHLAEDDVRQLRRKLVYAAKLRDQIAANPGSDAAQHEILRSLLRRVVLHEHEIEVSVESGMVFGVTDAANSPGDIVIRVPIAASVGNRSARLVLCAPGSKRVPAADPKVAALLAKSRDWFDRLASQGGHTVRDIAAEQHVSIAYVARVIHLAFLAPEIVTALMDGKTVLTMNGKRLMSLLPLSDEWEEQRRHVRPVLRS